MNTGQRGKQIRQVVWNNWPSMAPVNPSSINGNPVTLIENFVKQSDGSLRRRSGFLTLTNGLSGKAFNHIVFTPIGGVPTVVFKTDSGWDYMTSAGSAAAVNSITVGTDVFPPDDPARGSFSVFNAELYYCDKKTVWRWDGIGNAVRPGIPPLETTTANYNSDPQKGPTYDPTADPRWWRADDSLLGAGGKVGSFAASFSWYDPKRKIYGRRSKPHTAVIAYTIVSDAGTEPILNFSYSMTMPALDSSDLSSDYQVAVWNTSSMNIKSTAFEVHDNQGNQIISYSPDFIIGEYLSDTVFLEGIKTIYDPGSRYECIKDNNSLAAGERAMDTYERPRASQFMTILPGGVAVYFYPSSIEPPYGNPNSVIEYSIGHPEQVARPIEDTQTNRWTQRQPATGVSISYSENMRGMPIYHAVDSGANLILTSQAIYSLSFVNKEVVFNERSNGFGVRGESSIASSALGTSYISDEGWVSISGGISVIDSNLGFKPYLDLVSTGARASLASGSAGSLVLFFMPDTTPYSGVYAQAGSKNNTAICYDSQLKHVSRIRLGDSTNIDYAAGVSLDRSVIIADDGGTLMVWPNDELGILKDGPESSGAAFQSKLEFWLGEQSENSKRIVSFDVTFGTVNGVQADNSTVSPSVTVESFDQPDNTTTGYNKVVVDSGTLVTNNIPYSNRRVTFPQFNNMQGRYFKITIETDQTGGLWNRGELEIMDVAIKYETDSQSGHFGTT